MGTQPAELHSSYAPFVQAIFGVDTLSRTEVYKAFVDQYFPFVVHLIAKHNKVSRNAREIVQEILIQLQEANAIEKFFAHASLSMPETITGEQAAKALGLSWDRFRVAQRRSSGRDAWRKSTAKLPRPISGTDNSKKSVYRTSEIMALSTDMVYFRASLVGQSDISGIVPLPTKKHFQHYIARSVKNRFANFCRTEDRHNKERLHDAFPEFRPAVDDPSSWESRLPDMDPCSQEGRAEIGLLVRQLDRSPAGAHKQELFCLMEDGYDLERAIDKLEQLTAEDRRVTKRLCAPWIEMIQEAKAQRRDKSSPSLKLVVDNTVAA